MQEQPFSSQQEEVLLSLMRTADCLNRAFQRKIKPWGVTATQYNVLRILRGANPQGLTCSAIGIRMITAEPDITRLLARLKALKLIRQQRDRHDRRVVWTHISPAGLELLKEMDPVILEAPLELLGRLNGDELSGLIGQLEVIRNNCGGPEAGHADCDGRSQTPASGPISCEPRALHPHPSE
jgi:DNA-binding MarR family transcriptional regulator